MFKELKRFGKHSSIYGIGVVISRAIGFLMIPIYTRYLTPSDYGIIELLDLSFNIISTILISGIGMGIFKIYFDDDIGGKEVISTALIFNIIIVILSVLLLSCFADKVCFLFFGHTEYIHFFKIVFITLIAEVSLSVPFIYLRAKERSIFFTGLSIFRLIIGLVLNIYFIAFLKIGIKGVLYSALISGYLTCGIIIPLIIKEVGVSFSYHKLKKILVYGLPIIPASLCSIALCFPDRFFLRYFLGLNELGLYSLGYKLGIVLLILIISPFIQNWNAFIFSIQKKEDAAEIFSKILTYFTFILIFIGLGISILSKDALKIIATPSFFDAYKVVPLLVLGNIFLGINYVFQVGIYLKSKTKWLPYINGIGLVINIFLNWLLIPIAGKIGASLTYFITYFLIGLITYLISTKYYYISYEFNRILKLAAVGILIYLLSNLVVTSSILYSILLKGMLIISFPLLLHFLNFYNPEERNMIKEFINVKNKNGGFFWKRFQK